ncbi:MAG: hypothetical protein KDD78_19745, partial [Caldilineaceae bacterium]|nr:hypothetical protein [Caldilineaceae bacterium]
TVLKTDCDPPRHFLDFEAAQLDYYLTPSGPYAIQSPGPLHLMCGISGAEFVLLTPGDKLCFLPDPTANDERADWTTAWATILPAATPDPAAVGAGYCSQPGAVAFFDNSAGYAYAAGTRLGDLAADGDHVATLFPIFPYAGLFAPLTLGDGAASINAAINLDYSLADMQRQDVQPAPGAIFAPWAERHGPVFFDTTDNQRLTGFVRTAYGLLIDLNEGDEAPAGTLKRIYLATGTDNPRPTDGGEDGAKRAASGQNGTDAAPVIAPAIVPAVVAQPEPAFFALNPGPAGVIDPALANALLTGAELVIVTDETLVPAAPELGFGNEIMLGDFPFTLQVGAENAVLLFKFSDDKSLEQLLAEAKADHPAHFLGEETLPDV